ncbi:hypothetical protein N7494_001439 [Penicillium frequentans]|uniref:FAD-binding domain-containing protein n=1 Tax=Penicillium frequentans TaxID=3151616 RepID=A0AAD6GJX7_9EURO|nr:hypothetical protein N7494_001439 [Penicillium glabrum]
MASPNQMSDGFKILIAGGSLVGLGLALCFERAGLHPHTIRILQQLGVWEDIEKEVVPLQHRKHYAGDGSCFEDSHVLVNIEEILTFDINYSLKRPIIFMERCRALEILHSHVKDKSKLHARTAVVGYEENAQGVILTTEDGDHHHGHILIGADGIHSKVRKLMADKIEPTNKTLAKEINEAFTSEYSCIFSVSRNDPENQFLPDAMVHNVYYDDYSAIAAAGVEGLVFWFLFIKNLESTRTPNCPRFTDEDAEEYIQKYGSSLVGPGYTVKDLWDARVKATMVPLEEGVIKKWSHNRVVLMGDSVHKATVNPGLGGNLAYEGIARLTNGLVPLLKEDPSPTLEQLTEVFDQYVAGQMPRAETVVGISGQITRYEAQESWVLKFAARHIVPYVSDGLKAKLYSSFSKGGPWLEYLPLPAIDADLVKVDKNSSKGVAGKWIAGTIMVGTAAILWQTCRGFSVGQIIT